MSDGWQELEVVFPDPVYVGDEVYAKDCDGIERWLAVTNVDENSGTFGTGPCTSIIASDRNYGIMYGSARSKQFIEHVEKSENAFHSLRIRRRI